MKNSIFYKYFLIIFAAFILFEYANITVDYHSTIKYRLELLKGNREKIETQAFEETMIHNQMTEEQMRSTFKNAYKQQGYDIHLLVKSDLSGEYDIIEEMIETDYIIPEVIFRDTIPFDDIQGDLSVDLIQTIDTSYSLGKFSDEIIKEFEKNVDRRWDNIIQVDYKTDKHGNLIALRCNMKEYYAKNVKVEELLPLEWVSTELSGYTSSRIQYRDSMLDGEITNIYFENYYNACVEELKKIVPGSQNHTIELKKDGYFEYEEGIIVYDISYAASGNDLISITYDKDINNVFKPDYSENEMLASHTLNSDYLVYDFYYIDTTTLVDEVQKELMNSKASIYLVMTLLALAVSFILSEMLTKPIKAITEVTTKISNNDFNSKLSIQSKDEIGILSSNINHMSDRLKETIDNLNQEIENVKYLEGVRKEFIANFTHEIKTPLAIINGYIELLSKTEDNSKREEYLGAINKETNRMNKLIMSMLELSQLEAGKKQLKISEISMEECLTEIVDNYLPLIKNKSINLHIDIDDEVFDGDENEIKKVIGNFLSNAIRHTKENNDIEITFKEGIFSIENEGDPISEDDMKLIFETYVSHDRDGTGLGLAICKAILGLHQFNYGVENTKKGVRFYFMV